MFNADLAIEIFGEPACHGPGYYILAPVGINKDRPRYNKE